jgi:hypothetical protein
LFTYTNGDGPQTRSGAASKDDALHETNSICI